MLSEELKSWRTAAGLTQQELAGWMMCSLRTVQDMEKAGQLRADQELALDMASINLACARRDASVLTRTALKTWLAIETFITPQVRDSLGEPSPWQGGAENLPAYLAAIRALLPLTSIQLDGRDHDHGFRWEVVVLLDGDVLKLGDWVRGKRPEPHQVAMAAMHVLEREVEARRLFAIETRKSDRESWLDAADDVRARYRALAAQQTHG